MGVRSIFFPLNVTFLFTRSIAKAARTISFASTSREESSFNNSTRRNIALTRAINSRMLKGFVR